MHDFSEGVQVEFRNSYGKLQAFIRRVVNSFGFIPSILFSIFLCLGIFLIASEKFLSITIFSLIPTVHVNSVETLRAILSSFFTGIISILIFSFSMVMIVLNQTASQYSPRILNWLIGKRSNQYTLGIFLGTLVLTLVLLLNLPPDVQFNPAYNLAVIVNSILIFVCMALFVNIINSVSNDLQISNIIENIHKQTLIRISSEKTNASKNELDSIADYVWVPYTAIFSGYLQNIGQDQLSKIAQKHDLCIKIWLNTGKYYIKGDTLFFLNQANVPAEVVERIISHFVFYQGERIQDNSYYGMKQLSEIAVKALSPGINDPGTAGTCIDYLTELFVIWMEKSDNRYMCDKEGKIRMLIYPRNLKDLIDICLVPVLNYGSKDVNILQSLFVLLGKLGELDKKEKYKKELNLFYKSVVTEKEKHRGNNYFYEYLDGYHQKLRALKGYYED